MSAKYVIDAKKLKAQTADSIKAPERLSLEQALKRFPIYRNDFRVSFHEGAEDAAAFVTAFLSDPEVRKKTPSIDEQDALFAYHQNQSVSDPAALFSVFEVWRGTEGLLALGLGQGRYTIDAQHKLQLGHAPRHGLSLLARFVVAADRKRGPAVHAACRAAKQTLENQVGCAVFFDDAAWANELIDAFLKVPIAKPASWPLHGLLGTTDDPERLEKMIAHLGDDVMKEVGPNARFARLVGRLSAKDVERIFVVLLERGITAKWSSSTVESHAKVLAHIHSPEVARVLALGIGQKSVAKIAGEYFRVHLDLAHALDKVAQGKGAASKVAAALKESLGRTQNVESEVPTATSEALLPASLITPPWATKKRVIARPKRVLEVIVDVERCAVKRHRVLPPNPRSPERDAELLRGVPPEKAHGGVIYNLTEPVALQALAGRPSLPGEPLDLYITWLGEPAVPHVIRFIAADLSMSFEMLARAVSPRLALACAYSALANAPSPERSAARGWLGAHPAEAALGLVPSLLGEDDADSDVAERVLHSLHRGPHQAQVQTSVARYGEDAAREVARLMEKEGEARFPLKMPMRAKWAAPERLAPLLRKDGETLKSQHVEVLVQMLQISTFTEPYEGATKTLTALTDASRAAFSKALLQEYLLAGSPPSHAWVIHALALLAPDVAVALLGTQMRVWAQDGKVPLLHESLDVLAHIGTREALIVVYDGGQRSRYEDTAEKVRSLLARTAQARGISYASLEDMLVPELGLEGGQVSLDLGGRTLHVRLGGHLDAILSDAEGAVLSSFPRKLKSDDAAAYEKAKARYTALLDATETVGKSQVVRFERALRDQRSWRFEELEAHVFMQPLVRHIARRLVWQVEGTQTLFRVAEDSSLADANDAATSKPEPDARIVIAHPRRAPTLGRFGTWATEYRVIQPFAQIDRAVFSLELTEEEKVTRHVGRKVSYLSVLALTLGMGWRPGAPGSTGIDSINRTLQSGHVAKLALSPGMLFGNIKGRPEQTLGALTLMQSKGEAARFSELDALDLSELLLDVFQLA